jgi:AraC-like DNA-binding protein
VQKYTVNENTKGYQIIFTENFIVKYYDEKQVFNSQIIFNDAINSPTIQLTESQTNEIIGIAQNLYFEYHNTVDDEYKSPILRSGLHVLLMKLERFKQQQVPQKMNADFSDFFRFKNLVDEKCFSTRNVTDYCNELNFNQKKLNLITKSILNKTAKEFIDDRTILEIKRLLSNTNLPIKEIAYRAGFDEPTNFVKYFKNFTRQSPSDFRTSLK